MSTERVARMRGWRRWVPIMWAGYGAVYVVMLLVRGRPTVAAITAVLVVLTGAGLAAELHSSSAKAPQLLGWAQDERQRLIHQRSISLVGYVALAGAALAGFAAFIVAPDLAMWPMSVVFGLAVVYGIGLAVYQRRT